MPHIVLNGDVNVDDIFSEFKGIITRNDRDILKTSTIYISRDKGSIIIESLAIEKESKHAFLAMISRRNNSIVVRIYPGSEVEKTSGVKKILSEIAKQLMGMFPQLTIGETNLLEYLK